MDPFNVGNQNAPQPTAANQQNGEPELFQKLNSTIQPETKSFGRITFTDVSEEPQQQPSPSSAAPQQNIPKKRLPWKKILIVVVLALLLIASFAAAGFGITQYQRYGRLLPVESLLPEDPNLVMIATINPNDEQFTLLEANLKKFPGYEQLKKEIDPAGQGKSVSELLQEKIKKYSIDFQKDLAPALADTGIIVINDLGPLGSSLEKNALLLTKRMQTKDENAIALSDSPSVLGEETEKVEFPTLDFIAAIEIKDIKKANETLEKIKTDGQHELEKRTFEDYFYYAATIKPKDSSDKPPYQKLYVGLIARNLIITSREGELEAIITKSKQQELLSEITNKQQSKSLLDNKDFQTIREKLKEGTTKNSLIASYVKLNFNTFFKRDTECAGEECESITDYVKYPNDIIMGFSATNDVDGIKFNLLSNRQDLTGVKNIAFASAMSARIPEKVNDLWADIFWEYGNFNDFYYNFKKNNLTEKGLSEWSEALKPINEALGINFEQDIIDQINGISSTSIFTKKSGEPAGVVVVTIKDEEKMYKTIETVTESWKKLVSAQLTRIAEMKLQSNSKEFLAYQSKAKTMLTNITSAKITPTETANGKIHSFKVPNTLISFDFSLKDNELIFGSHYAVVEALLQKNSNTLAQNSLYKEALPHAQQEGFAQSFIVTQGVVNIVTYFTNNMYRILSSAMGAPSDDSAEAAPEKENESLFAFGAILRTVKYIHATQSIQDKFTQSSLFFNIKELPAEEKKRAEDIIAKEME